MGLVIQGPLCGYTHTQGGELRCSELPVIVKGVYLSGVVQTSRGSPASHSHAAHAASLAEPCWLLQSSTGNVTFLTGNWALFLLQIEVSPPQADDLGRVRQITQEKEALAQRRARAEQARQVCTDISCCNCHCASAGPHLVRTMATTLLVFGVPLH